MVKQSSSIDRTTIERKPTIILLSINLFLRGCAYIYVLCCALLVAVTDDYQTCTIGAHFFLFFFFFFLASERRERARQSKVIWKRLIAKKNKTNKQTKTQTNQQVDLTTGKHSETKCISFLGTRRHLRLRLCDPMVRPSNSHIPLIRMATTSKRNECWL